MDFYTTYYKSNPTDEQTKVMKEIFDNLDVNKDKALNKTELANIFTNQTFTDAEKELLMKGSDKDDDGFLTYLEFSPTFLEFDVDDSADISAAEGDLFKKKIEELGKQLDINAQYKILASVSSTTTQKNEARDKVDLFEAQRYVLNSDEKIQEKTILISDKQTKAQTIQNELNSTTSTLLEFERAQKAKELASITAEKDQLLLEKDILEKKRSVQTADRDTIVNQQAIKAENAKLRQNPPVTPDPAKIQEYNKNIAVLEYQKSAYESQLSIAQNALEQYTNNQQITVDENLLTKFFVPEMFKEQARKELETLNDNQQLLAQQNLMNQKVSFLSQKRAEKINALYDYQVNGNAAAQQTYNDIDAHESQWQLEATIETKKTDLLNKQIQLKGVIALTSQGEAFVQKKTALEAAIAALQAEIESLGG